MAMVTYIGEGGMCKYQKCASIGRRSQLGWGVARRNGRFEADAVIRRWQSVWEVEGGRNALGVGRI